MSNYDWFRPRQRRQHLFIVEGKHEKNELMKLLLKSFPEIDMDLDDVIALGQKEYESILEELDNLELLSDDGSVSLDTEDYLIFKLEKECHVTNSIPANLHTKKYYVDELKRIEKSLS